MKYAVKLGDLYLCLCGCQSVTSTTRLPRVDHDRAKAVAKASGGRVVRVLSHEEAKNKAAAMALVKHAEWCRENKQGTWSSVAQAEKEAEKLWPALFHAGDGKLPRTKAER